MRAGLVSLVYGKSLVLSKEDRAGCTTGDIVNLQSTNSTRVQDPCTYRQVEWLEVYQSTLAFVSFACCSGGPSPRRGGHGGVDSADRALLHQGLAADGDQGQAHRIGNVILANTSNP